MLSDLFVFLTAYLATDTSTFEEQARVIGNLILIAWAIHILDWGIGRGALSWVFGVRPRELTGLLGIFFAPFLHGIDFDRNGEPNNSHIVGNTLAFAVLGLFIALLGIKTFYVVTVIAALSDGVGTWLFGRENSYHIGASGVIFGYIGFLLLYGFVSRNPIGFLLGLATLWLYGRYVDGILPGEPGISWEGHFFGFLGGVFAAYLLSYINSLYLT